MGSLPIVAGILRGPTLWPGMSSLAFLISCVGYIVRQIVVGRIHGRSWQEILEDGTKPITGSVWLDGLLFFGIFVTAGVLVVLAMWIQW